MKNFEIIDSKERISEYDADEQYSNVRYLMVNTEEVDGTLYGNIYAISRDFSTLSQLVQIESEFNQRGIGSLIGGEYMDGIDDVEIISIQREL